MTGFGSAICSQQEQTVSVEIRSVNHRYLDLLVRLPKGYLALEDRLRPLVGEYIHRGRVEIFLSIEDFSQAGRTVWLDRALLQGYLSAIDEAKDLLETDFTPTVDMLINLPDVLVSKEAQRDPDRVWPLVEQAVRSALTQLTTMRREEGRRLQQDVLKGLHRLEAILDEIASRAPTCVAGFRARLAQQIEAALGAPLEDEQRLLHEVAIFAEKVNIDEELTRARSHLEQFAQTCQTQGSVGRKLDFLVQELNREVNTIASKAQDGLIAQWVVEAKSELEKVREQIQNVE